MRGAVSFSGPLFDGSDRGVFADIRVEVEKALATEGLQLVQANLHSNLRHPTGTYQSHVVVDRVQDAYMVTDHGVVYGPWLEGTGSRNKTTRFKGYQSFRKARQTLERRAGDIAQAVVDSLVRRLN